MTEPLPYLVVEALTDLRAIDPHRATPEDMRRCEAMLAAIDRSAHFGIWLEAQAILATFLLEARAGDRSQNLARATSIYRGMLESNLTETHPQFWEAAIIGLSNCLMADSNSPIKDFRPCFDQLDKLAAHLRRGSDPESLAVALSCYSNVLMAAPVGDRDENLARALALSLEEIEVLGSAERHPALWARAHHNIALLYQNRRLGGRSQNVDDAIRALRVALAWRSRESDPAGRARTLRALALLLPEWSGADSLANANAMAEACRREAEDIAQSDPRAAPRPASWGSLAGQRSALNVDLDRTLGPEPAEATRQLEQLIANHRAVIAKLSPASEPSQWADWKGGLGRLLARLGHLERSNELLNEANKHLREAIPVASTVSHRRLCRDLRRAIGEFGHQIEAWELSHQGYREAFDLSDQLFDEAADPDSRRQELVDMLGFAQLAAYGAAREGKLDDAIRLAEQGRVRSLIEMMSTTALLSSGASQELRNTLAAASRRVAQLETELGELKEKDPRAVAQKTTNRLASSLGVDPRLLNYRVTNHGNLTEDMSADYLRIVADLRIAHTALREAIASARMEQPGKKLAPLDADGIRVVAATMQCPLIYLLATVYGAAALIVPPTGDVELLRLDAATDDVTQALLHGSNGNSGYIESSVGGDASALARSLPLVIETLAETVTLPLVHWLTDHQYDRAVVVPLGSIGLLPIHAAAPDKVALGYAPSARALQTALALLGRPAPAKPTLLAVGNPSRASVSPLPLAVAEARVIAGVPDRWSTTSVLVRGDANLDATRREIDSATHIHFACHGKFRQFEPLDSALLLAGEDSISLRDLLGGKVHLSVARLAVLCACHTANVEAHTLPDEMLGLPAGMLLAGVPAVVGTMWQVDEAAGALFSLRFYEELDARADPLAAVAVAQRWLRDAPAEQLVECVKRMQAALAAGDDETAAALSQLWRRLVSLSPNDRPFAPPEYWAAFAYMGP